MDEQMTSPRILAKTAPGSWRGYVTAMLGTVLTLLGVYSIVLATLSAAHILPPPALVNELCADEKLRWIRNHHANHPNLLVAGSSIAWRDIDSSKFVQRQPGTRPLNGGMCHAQMNQTDFVTKYLVRNLPSLRTVVTVVSPLDFVDCRRSTTRLFNPTTADRYVFGDDWPYRLYLSQFAPRALLRNAVAISRWRHGGDKFDSLEMARYGGGPLRVTGNRGLLYGPVKRQDPACVAALHNLATTLDAGGRRLFVAMAPVNPDWSSRYDPQGQAQARLIASIQQALRGTGATFWDGNAAFDGSSPDFTDAIHINWPAAKRFSTLLASALFSKKS